jgi:hypothetical protein
METFLDFKREGNIYSDEETSLSSVDLISTYLKIPLSSTS